MAINPVSLGGYDLYLYFSILYRPKCEKHSLLTANHFASLILVFSFSLCLSPFGNSLTRDGVKSQTAGTISEARWSVSLCLERPSVLVFYCCYKQIVTNLEAENNTNVLSYTPGIQTSKMGFTGLKSRYQQG